VLRHASSAALLNAQRVGGFPEISHAQDTLADLYIAIPSFTSTPDPKLNELLSDVRQRVFLPAALSRQHQHLIYRRRYDELLNKDPGVTVVMDDGEEIRLRPTEFYHEPRMAKVTSQFVSLLRPDTPWTNVPMFLQGLRLMHWAPPDPFWEKLTRKAGEMGKVGVLMDCARSVNQTDFRLYRPRVAREFFVAFYTDAAKSGFEGPSMERAWKRAQTLALMLESKDHLLPQPRHNVKSEGAAEKPDSSSVQRQADPRSDPAVLATLLELCARTALKEGTDDLRRQVSTYAAKLAYLIQNSPGGASRFGNLTEFQTSTPSGKLSVQSIELETELIMRGAIEAGLKVGSIADPDEAILKGYLEVLRTTIEEKESTLRTASTAGKPRRSSRLYSLLQQSE